MLVIYFLFCKLYILTNITFAGYRMKIDTM